VSSLSFRQAADLYLAWSRAECRRVTTWKRINISLKALVRTFEDRELASIQAADLESFKAARIAGGIRPVTVRHDLHALAGLLRYARREGWIRHDPLNGVRIPSDADAIRMHVVNREEEARYFAAALAVHSGLYDHARLVLLTGLRPSEVLALRAADYDPDRGTAFVCEGKTRAARRTLKLVQEAREIAERRTAGKGASQFWFPGRWPGSHARPLHTPHRDALQLAGVRFCLYDLRHTFATRMADRGTPIATLAAILGHGNLRCVMRYVHPSQAAMDEAMLRFAS
jgi:integrase